VIVQNTISRTIFSVHCFLSLSVTVQCIFLLDCVTTNDNYFLSYFISTEASYGSQSSTEVDRRFTSADETSQCSEGLAMTDHYAGTL